MRPLNLPGVRPDTSGMERRHRRALATVTLVLALLESTALPLLGTGASAAQLRTAPLALRSAGTRPSLESFRLPAAEATSSTSEGSRTMLARVERAMPLTSDAGAGRVVGTMPAASRFFGEPLVAWVQELSSDGRYGLVSVPYVAGDRSGWMRLRGLDLVYTRLRVEADLSAHRLTVLREGEVLFSAPIATGVPGSPTPTGHYFVTDRVPFPGGGDFGTFAFGISGIQPNLPLGWTGGDQLAIHGTNIPSSIGRSASAGCLRVSERVLDRLRPLLRLGTPVTILG